MCKVFLVQEKKQNKLLPEGFREGSMEVVES